MRIGMGSCDPSPLQLAGLDPIQIAWYSYCPSTAMSAPNAYLAWQNYLYTAPVGNRLSFLAWGGNPTDPVFHAVTNPANAQYLPPKGQGFIDPLDPNYIPPYTQQPTQAPVPLNTPFQNPPAVTPTPVPLPSQPVTTALQPPSAPATPTYQQIAGGQTLLPSTGTQISNVMPSSSFGFTMPTMPAILTESSVGGIPNWMLLAGAVVALMVFKKK